MAAATKLLFLSSTAITIAHATIEQHCEGAACRAARVDDEEGSVLLQMRDGRQGERLDDDPCPADVTVDQDEVDAVNEAFKTDKKTIEKIRNLMKKEKPKAGPSAPSADPAYNPDGFCTLKDDNAREQAAFTVAGQLGTQAQIFNEFNAYIWTKGKSPVNPATSKEILNNGPWGKWGPTWGKIRSAGLATVSFPTLLQTDGANRTAWFTNAAWATCWNPAPLAEGPMIFKYSEVAFDLADYGQERGFYTATAPQVTQWFIKEVPLFLYGAEHKGIRNLLQHVGFANANNVNIKSVKKVKKLKDGCKKPSLSQVAEEVGPLVMEQVWDGVPTDKARKAMRDYSTWGAMSIFGKDMYALLKPMGISKKISNSIEEVTDWAVKTDMGAQFEKARKEGYAKPMKISKRNLVKVIVTATMFAGIIGTTDMTLKCVEYQQRMPSHVALFKADPEKYLIELMRFDSAVTSFTKVLAKNQTMNLEGRQINLAKGTPVQDTLATSNRDPLHWKDPEQFLPSRSQLGDTLSWNGRAEDVEAMDFEKAPRFCPGYCLSLKVGAAVCARMLGSYDELFAEGKLLQNDGEVKCKNF